MTVFKNHGSVFYGLSHNLNFMIACPFVLNPVSEPFLPPPLLVYQWSQLMVISSLFFNSSLKTFDTIDHFLKHLFPLASGTILSLAFPSALCLLLCLLCWGNFILWTSVNFPLSTNLAAFYTWYVVFSFSFRFFFFNSLWWVACGAVPGVLCCEGSSIDRINAEAFLQSFEGSPCQVAVWIVLKCHRILMRCMSELFFYAKSCWEHVDFKRSLPGYFATLHEND